VQHQFRIPHFRIIGASGSSCDGRDILYVTERCVFRLLETGEGPKVELIEIAPGVRLQEDVLDLMEFTPVVRNIQLMDQRCFCP
jgi:propionate CoA-transferase